MSKSKIIISEIPATLVLCKNLNSHLVAQYRSNQITMDDVHKIAYEQLCVIYNTLFRDIRNYYQVNGWANLQTGMIIDRTLFENFVHNLAERNPNTYGCFNYLKKKGVIGVCGAGYIFEEEELK